MAARSNKTTHTNAAQISVGIGSWADPEYVGVLFPKGVKAAERLSLFAQRLGHVEVNATAYRTPERKTLAGWAAATPPDFCFDVKLHRAFSERPAQIATDGDFVARWRDSLEPLVTKNKLGALLLVLPPGFGPENRRLEELDGLVSALAPLRIAVELRHSGWVDKGQRERTLAFFRDRKLVWVAVDMPRIKGSTIMPVVDEVTNPELAYLRLHGRRKDWLTRKTAAEKHEYAYSTAELKEIAIRVRGLAAQATEVHVVANNHAKDFAPKTALALQRLLRITPA